MRGDAGGPHRRLLRRPRRLSSGGRPVDAIVVPMARSADRAQPALQLAADLGCPVIALCTGAARAADVVAHAQEVTRATCIAVDTAGYTSPLLDFDTTGWPLATAPPYYDLSLKRNIGLLLAWLSGWHVVFFLDDDVEGLDSLEIAFASEYLNSAAAAAFAMTKFEDNSVVCHATRLGRGHQDVFVSGGACLVDTTRVSSFYPAIYNEDWFFLFDLLRARKVADAGDVMQLEFDPFADPERARAEEFGDVVAEGLMALVHRGAGYEAADPAYWEGYLEQRRDFIQRAKEDILASVPADPQAEAALAALGAAEERRGEIEPADLADYVTTWRKDVGTWRGRLEKLPRSQSLEDGLGRVGLLSSALSVPARRTPVVF